MTPTPAFWVFITIACLASIAQVWLLKKLLWVRRCEHDWVYEKGPPEEVRCRLCGVTEQW